MNERIVLNALDDLITSTKKRDKYEIEYELEKSRMLFSAEVGGLGNQSMRDAQVTLLLEKKGMYRKMCELRTQARQDYYDWSTFTKLIKGGDKQ